MERQVVDTKKYNQLDIRQISELKNAKEELERNLRDAEGNNKKIADEIKRKEDEVVDLEKKITKKNLELEGR